MPKQFKIFSRWLGQGEICDFFAKDNSKANRFFSKYWVPGCSGVDAFSQADFWSECLGWWVPPVYLVAKTISFARAFRARGVLGCPFGVPSTILSNNGTKYRSTEPLATGGWSREAFEKLQISLRRLKIKWNFIPIRDPWRGGVYERLFRILKTSLRNAIEKSLITKDEFFTLAIESCGFANRRPFTATLNESRVRRPIDLVKPNIPLGFPADHAEEEVRTLIQTDMLHLWLAQNTSLDIAWETYTREYLTFLRERYFHSHHNPKGDAARAPKEVEVVLLFDNNTPRSQWRLAKVAKAFRSPIDGAIRSCDVHTANGRTSNQPINKLVPL